MWFFELHGHIDTTHRFTSYQFCRSLLFTKRSKRSLRISKSFGNEPLKRQPNILCLLNSSDPYNVLVYAGLFLHCRRPFLKKKPTQYALFNYFITMDWIQIPFVDTLFFLIRFQIGGTFYDRKLSKKCQLLL